MKKIVFTGGGTAGHITPNIALFEKLLKKNYLINYMGMKNSMEETLIKKEGITFFIINGGKLRRYFDVENFKDGFKILLGFIQSVFIIKRIKPDIVFSKGGFVSCPVVWAAWINRIPVIIHESDMTPGLANKLAIPFATQICYSFPETRENLPKNKSIYTGLPIRKSIFEGNKKKGVVLCNFKEEKPIILVVGGSQGSGFINNVIRKKINEILNEYQVCHVCGKGNIDEELKKLNGYKQFEYVGEELPHLFAMSDLIISRAGATFIFEIVALKKLNILIPLSKKVSRGDQILNAKSFEKLGYSRVLNEEAPFDIEKEIKQTFKEKDRYYNEMNNIKSIKGDEKILEVIETLIKSKKSL